MNGNCTKQAHRKLWWGEALALKHGLENFDQQTSYNITDNEVTFIPPDNGPLGFGRVFRAPGTMNRLQKYDLSHMTTECVLDPEATGLGNRYSRCSLKHYQDKQGWDGHQGNSCCGTGQGKERSVLKGAEG